MRLDAEGQRRDVEQDHVFDVAAQDARLHRGADGDDFVGIDVAVRLLAEGLLHRLDNARHACLAADEDHFIDVLRRKSGLLQRVVDGIDRLLDQVLDHLLELAAGEDAVEMLRTRGVGGDER